jgi:PAS domain S-box-containing protein
MRFTIERKLAAAFSLLLMALIVATVMAYRSGGPRAEPGLFVAVTVLELVLLALAAWVIAKDITGRKRTERALRESEARTTAIINAAVDGIICIDARGTIELANPATLSIFGYTEAELIGKNVRLLMPEPYMSEHDGYLENYHRTGVAKVIGIGREVVGRRKDGSTFPADLAVSVIPPDVPGAMPRFAGIVRDVTVKKRAESLRIAKDAAEAANRAKDDFLAAVSHDLRTPIGSIVLLAELLRRKNPTEDQLRKIDRIKDAANTQSRLIEDILDATRILHGKLRVEMRPVGMGAVVRAAIAAVEPMAGEQGVAIALEESDPAGSGLRVIGDCLRLQQVCWNLLTNAIKFSSRGGEVRARVGEDETGIYIVVIDRGQGIDAKFLPHVFDRMSQAAGASGRRRSGLGLGLAIVRHIVELHGGSVQARSDGAGHGATFTVMLPRPTDRGSGAPTAVSKDVRVMVGEDGLP